MTTNTIKPATPLPWEWKRTPITEFALGGAQGDALYIKSDPATTYISMHQWDAAYIVHACNAYPELVAALREVADSNQLSRTYLMDIARALLARLERDK